MEYLFYVLVILSLLALCLYLARLPGQARLDGRQAALAERARKRRQSAEQNSPESAALARQRRLLSRDLRNVPTPWGWPGNEVRHSGELNGTVNGNVGNGGAGPLQQWIERLVSEKRTVDDSAYLMRRDKSLRTMIEDRYGRTAKPGEIAYRQVKTPMLRDPSRPHDQMDNFPSGRTERIVARLEQQPGTPSAPPNTAASRAAAPLKEIKTPWGW